MNLKKYIPGVILSAIIGIGAIIISNNLLKNHISPAVFALLLGMIINPLINTREDFKDGMNLVSKKFLRTSIILMGATLSFSQVLQVGKYSLIVMIFTLFIAFAGGYYIGRLFKMDWKLSSLISAGTGICGASAIGAIAPTINAKPKDIAYSISATFIFDILMVVLFPIMGRYIGISDLGYGLWAGTAVNDTSSVVAAGYAFSDLAGSYAIIVKLTRTLSIIPTVIIFSYINERVNSKRAGDKTREKVNLKNVFPWFILGFLMVVALKSLGLISEDLSQQIAGISKFLMIMSLASIGLKTNFMEVSKAGIKPMIHGFIISTAVVVGSLGVQILINQF